MKKAQKQIIIAIVLQLLFAASLSGQKYQNGTRLLKGAEVLSATPLQLDYVLETLADTAKIVTNIHEGKTHLVLDDGSGKWREWWYYMGKWRVKSGGALPEGKDGSIQTRNGDSFSGSNIGINEGFLYSLDETPSDIGMTNKNATIRATPHGQSVMEASRTDANGVVTSNVFVTSNDVSTINEKYSKGSLLQADTSKYTHWKTRQTGNDYWNFISSLPDTTFYIRKRLKFDQTNNTSIYIKNDNLHLKDESGDYSLSELSNGTNGTVTSVGLTLPANVFTVTNSPVTESGTLTVNYREQPKSTFFAAPITAQGTPVFRQIFPQDLPSISWSMITSKPTTISGFGITDAYTATQTRTVIGDTAKILRNLIKNKTGGGSVTSVGLSMPNLFTVSGSPVTGSGTLTATLTSQTKNTVLAAPATGNGVPSFRLLQETDIPGLSWNKINNTPTTLGDYGIANAYTKTETDALLNIPGNNYQMLMLYNKRPAVIPRSHVSIQPTHTEFIFSGYEKTWNYPDIRYPAAMMVDATGFNFSGTWQEYRTQIDTRSGSIRLWSQNDDNPLYSSMIDVAYGSLNSYAQNVFFSTPYFSIQSSNGTNKGNTFRTRPEESKIELREKYGNTTYHTDFEVNHGSLIFSKSKEDGEGMVRLDKSFYVGDNFYYDRYFSYSPHDTTMYVYNKLNLMSANTPEAVSMTVTGDDDIQFSSKATELTEQGITLAQIMQKGQILVQATEPAIPDGTFAFWVNGTSFYLVLRHNGTQKKLQLQ